MEVWGEFDIRDDIIEVGGRRGGVAILGRELVLHEFWSEVLFGSGGATGDVIFAWVEVNPKDKASQGSLLHDGV